MHDARGVTLVTMKTPAQIAVAFREDVARPFRQHLRRRTAERRAHATAFALLEKHDEHQHEADEHVNDGDENVEEVAHERAA